MKRFRYGIDPLCLLACVAYAVGRWGLRHHVPGGFWRYQFTDLLLIPAALPLMLWFQRRIGLRTTDARPSWREIGLHLAVWSVAAELIAPLVLHTGTADWRDVVAYAAGAVLAGGWWSLA